MGLWQLIFANRFFAYLAKQHSEYYLSLGSPTYSYMSFSQRMSAVRFFARVITGRLKDSPDDQRFRELIRIYRLVFWFLVILLSVAIFYTFKLN